MCHTLCHCVPGLQPEQARLYWCHRLLIWTKAFGNGFGVSATPGGAKGHFWTRREGCGHGRVLTNPPQVAPVWLGAVVQGQAWTERFRGTIRWDHADPGGLLAERPQYLVPGEGQRPSLRDSLHHSGKNETFLLHFWLLCRNCSLTTASLEGLTTS